MATTYTLIGYSNHHIFVQIKGKFPVGFLFTYLLQLSVGVRELNWKLELGLNSGSVTF